MDGIVIGIDLGTTNSCVSYFFNNTVKIVENCYGKKTTPSFIYYPSSNEVIVGKNAKKIAINKPEFGIYGIKRLVGRKFDDYSLKENLDYFLFRVEADQVNDPIVVLNQNNTTVKITPKELCTIILKQLKADAEEKLNCVLKEVVITVPAYFNVRQREVTLAAAKDAGFTVLKLLNEPTAAALSFYHEYDFDEENYFVVYDLGGGTFDVAILKKINNDIKIIGVAGDMWLGGQDFDNVIGDYVCGELKRKYGCNMNAENKKNDLRRIYNKCEEAKKELTTLEETTITLKAIVDNHPSVDITLTRKQLDTMCDKLFQRTINIVDTCLRNCNIGKEDVKEVILAGGSTRIKKIEKMIRDYFGRDVLNKLVNRDECVAEGAAIQAAMLSTHIKQKINKIKLIDVIPLSLGVADFVDKMDFVIKRNTKIPVSVTVDYTTYDANQDSIYLRIYEGERLNAKKNRFLGDLTISDITPAPPGKCKITVTMSVDTNSILTVTAKETFRDNIRELKVNYLKGNKSEKEIYDFLVDAEKNKKEDEMFERFARYKAYLLQYCSAIIYNLDKKKLANKYKVIYDVCVMTKEEESQTEMDEEEKIKKLVESVEACCEHIVKSKRFKFMPTRNFSSYLMNCFQ